MGGLTLLRLSSSRIFVKLNSAVYYPERELMEVPRYLQASSLIIGKHRYRTSRETLGNR